MVSLIFEGEDDCHGAETVLNNYARSLLDRGVPSNELTTSARELLVPGITKMGEGPPSRSQLD
eukprot:3920542-Pyramimonas_sp.AAC.1